MAWLLFNGEVLCRSGHYSDVAPGNVLLINGASMGIPFGNLALRKIDVSRYDSLAIGVEIDDRRLHSHQRFNVALIASQLVAKPFAASNAADLVNEPWQIAHIVERSPLDGNAIPAGDRRERAPLVHDQTAVGPCCAVVTRSGLSHRPCLDHRK